MERWTWTVFPRSAGTRRDPVLLAGGVCDEQGKAVGCVEHVLRSDDNAAFGEIIGPGGRTLAARRGAAGAVVWRDRWPLDDA